MTAIDFETGMPEALSAKHVSSKREIPTTKIIIVGGRDLFVCGRAGDTYLDNLHVSNHDNDFLLYVIKHSNLAEDASIFDIGANIGVTATILATAAPGGRLFAFEPDTEAYLDLLRTIENQQIV